MIENSDRSKDPNRRSFIGQLVCIPALLTLSPGIEKFMREKVTDLGGFTGPYLQNLTPHGVSIMVVDHEDSETWVELEGDKKWVIKNKEDGLYEIGTGVKRYLVTNLRPDTTYRYRIFRRVVTKFKTSFMEFADIFSTPYYSFTTPGENATTVSCRILNDIHGRPPSYGHLLGLIREPFDFVVLNGDLVLGETIDRQQLSEEILEPNVQLYAKEKPFVFVRGNHEARGPSSGRLKEYFAYPNDRYYFNFQWGPVNFTVLDSGEDKEDSHKYYAGLVDFDNYRETQAIWLENIMKSDAYTSSLYKVVIMHIPPFHSADWHGAMHCRKVFSPLFEKYKVDMVISGHAHRYGLYPPSKDHGYPIVVGGGPLKGERSLISLKADSTTMKITLLSEEGNLIGSYDVNAG